MSAPNVKSHTPEYIETPDAVARLADRIGSESIIALDTEGASFHRFVDRIYLLQLSTREISAVIDPLPLGKPLEIGTLLEDPHVEIVFHDADYDLRLLHQDYGWQVRHIFDTRIAAQLLGKKSFGLAALLESYFGVKLDKRHQRADWSMRPLTAGMLEYAAQDTMHLIPLRDRLRVELESAGRWSWAAEEFSLLEGTRWDPDDDGLAFLRVKGARDLSRRELATLRELVNWRNRKARELDRATFRVIANQALLEIARAAPQNRRTLVDLKGVPRSIAERYAAELLDSVQRGLAVPESDLPRLPRAPRWERDPDFDSRTAALRTARDRVAQSLELDPGVLCSRDRLEAVARKKPRSPEEFADVPQLRKWQAEVLGEEFLKALRAHS